MSVFYLNMGYEVPHGVSAPEVIEKWEKMLPDVYESKVLVGSQRKQRAPVLSTDMVWHVVLGEDLTTASKLAHDLWDAGRAMGLSGHQVQLCARRHACVINGNCLVGKEKLLMARLRELYGHVPGNARFSLTPSPGKGLQAFIEVHLCASRPWELRSFVALMDTDPFVARYMSKLPSPERRFFDESERILWQYNDKVELEERLRKACPGETRTRGMRP